MAYRVLTVKYLIDEEEYKRLIRIMELSKAAGLSCTSADEALESVMRCGSKYDIDDKLALYESQLNAYCKSKGISKTA